MDDHFARVLDTDAVTGTKRLRDDIESSSADASSARRKVTTAAPALSKQELDALVESASAQEMDQLDARALRSMTTALEKVVRKNALLRSKYPDAPEKFMDSEVALDAELTRWKQVAAAPAALVTQLVELQVVPLLLGLFAHENVDIRLDVVALLADLTDADGAEDGAVEARRVVVRELLAHKLLPLLVTTLEQLDVSDNATTSDSHDEEVAGVYNTLQILENLADLEPATCASACETTAILPFLLAHVASSRAMTQNKLYASEVLSILLQSGPRAQAQLLEPATTSKSKPRDLLDELLQAIAPYRKRDPATDDEQELVENLVNALCSVLLLPKAQDHFRRLEGVELVLRCLRDRALYIFYGALRILDHALMANARNCERVVQVGGLKALFAVFMGKKRAKAKAKTPVVKRAGVSAAALKAKEEENVASILASLCHLLTPASPDDALDRLDAKFVERDMEKLDRVVDLFVKYLSRVEARDAADDDDDEEEDDADERYVARLDAGLFTLQRITHVVAHVCGVSAKLRAYVLVKLHEHRIEMSVLSAILQEQLAMLPPTRDDDKSDTTNASDTDDAAKVEAQRTLLLRLLKTLEAPESTKGEVESSSVSTEPITDSAAA